MAFVSHCSSQKTPCVGVCQSGNGRVCLKTHFYQIQKQEWNFFAFSACKMVLWWKRKCCAPYEGPYKLQVCKSPNCTYRLSNNLKTPRQVNSFLYRDPTSICSHELARAAANAWSQITTSEQSRFYPTIWSLICLNPPLCCALNPQQSLIPL